jgi:hypothetical protein
MSKMDVAIVQTNIGLLLGVLERSGKVESYTDLANRLSKLAGRNGNAWGWRYVQSVHKGSVAPSKNFAHAVEVLAAEIDGMPAFVSDTEPVTVHAKRGAVRPNAIVLAFSKSCANPRCTIHFIPIVPWQKFCPRCRNRKVTKA